MHKIMIRQCEDGAYTLGPTGSLPLSTLECHVYYSKTRARPFPSVIIFLPISTTLCEILQPLPCLFYTVFSMETQTSKPFRVIVVGAGPVGLFFAHALSQAGIDYVVLEQSGSIVQHRGAGIFLYSDTVRLLDQLGLYEKMKDYATFEDTTHLLAQGGGILKAYHVGSDFVAR
jgi:hypothetical protein